MEKGSRVRAKPLLNNRLTIAQQLLNNRSTIAWPSLGDCLAIAWPLLPGPPAMGTDPLSSLRLRFAADKGSVPKASVSSTPHSRGPLGRRGRRPLPAPVRIRLTPHSFRLTSRPSAPLRCGQRVSPQGSCLVPGAWCPVPGAGCLAPGP